MQPAPHFDPAGFTTSPYVKRVEKPWGYELHWVPESAPYMGKLLHINAGTRLSLQVHDQKQESWFLVNGHVVVEWEDSNGQMITTTLQTGVGYSTQVGQKHRLRAITDSDVVEVSTPEAGTTWRLEDDFARPHETPTQRKIERNE